MKILTPKNILEIELKLIEWCKLNKYANGDGYNVRITNKGKWAVSYTNDYPLQHGPGREYILTENDFVDAMNIKI